MILNRIGRASMLALSLVAICIVFGAVGQILMKNGMSQVGQIGSLGKLISLQTILRVFSNPYVIGGLFLYAIGAFLWLGALSSLDVSFMYPLVSLGYVLTAVLAFVFLKEDITLIRWGGIVLIVLGSFMILRT
jgi:drug/metabolite transporter (DMT)-like permease